MDYLPTDEQFEKGRSFDYRCFGHFHFFKSTFKKKIVTIF
jgi:hypothetical protein